ncbi:MAG TPA: MFS transporter [Acidimicrobiales bacterium]|nr:MFS transporter [Acidimicrobiales bacterium]
MTAPGSLDRAARARHPLSRLWVRELEAYPTALPRYTFLAIVVLATVVLYYELYVGGGVAPYLLTQLHMSFLSYVYIVVVGNAVGAFSSLVAGLGDRYGRANLVVYGLMVTGLLTVVAIPHAGSSLVYGVEFGAVAFVEGIILVATPALIRDFSPQVGRASAMGFWTLGPVVGSLVVALVATHTLPVYRDFQSQYVICGIVGLVMFGVALVGLRELSPRLRDQLMVGKRDLALVEARAKGIDVEASLRHPWRQMLHVDVIGSAFGVSVLLLVYYTAVGFFTIFLTTVFGFSTSQANGILTWDWAVDAAALIAVGWVSDRVRVRKPFMLVGGLGTAVMTIVLLLQTGAAHSGYYTLVWEISLLALFLAVAYAPWMASFTETVEARNPALTATGLAVWGWIIRAVIAVSTAFLPVVVTTVTTLVTAPAYLTAFAKARAAGIPLAKLPPALVHHLRAIKEAAAASPGQWQTWLWVCVAGAGVFCLLIFTMVGRWSPRRAKADQERHDQAVQAELASLAAGSGQPNRGDPTPGRP